LARAISFRCRKQFAHGQRIRGGGQETDHSYELANGVGEDRAQAADPVGDKAPNLPAQKSETEQHREHHRADRRRNPDIGAQSHKMALRHHHWHATAETRGSKHR